MDKLRDDIGRHGVVSMGELLRLGHWRERVNIAIMYGRVIRVRRGWYALPGEAEAVMRAWRVGGRLACVSAIAYHRGGDEAELHVEVPANAARLRNPDDPRRRLAPSEAVVVNWARRPSRGDGRAVHLEDAQVQRRRCGSYAASSESASRMV